MRTVLNNKHLLWLSLGTAAILMVPLIAMQFSDEWDWKLSDFIIIGVLLFSSGLVYEFLSTKARSTKQRMAIGAAVVIVVLFVWAELAVGIFGTPFAGS